MVNMDRAPLLPGATRTVDVKDPELLKKIPLGYRLTITPGEWKGLKVWGDLAFEGTRANNHGKGSSATATDPRNDYNKVKTEFSSANLLGLPYRPKIDQDVKGIDIGGIIQVRSIDILGYRLFIKPDDIAKWAGVPYLLVYVEGNTCYLIGWLYAREAPSTFEEKIENRENCDDGFMCRYLRPVDDLRNWIRRSRW